MVRALVPTAILIALHVPLHAQEHTVWLQAHGSAYHAVYDASVFSARAAEPRYGIGFALAPAGRFRAVAAWEWERAQYQRPVLGVDRSVNIGRTAILMQVGTQVCGDADHQWWLLAGPAMQGLRGIRVQEPDGWVGRETVKRTGWALRMGVRWMQRAHGAWWWAVEPYGEYQLAQDHEGYYGNNFSGVDLPDRQWSVGLQLAVAFGLADK